MLQSSCIPKVNDPAAALGVGIPPKNIVIVRGAFLRTSHNSCSNGNMRQVTIADKVGTTLVRYHYQYDFQNSEYLRFVLV